MASSTKIFSLEGKGLKLDTAADVEPHIKILREMEDVEEVKLLGNTLGVEACKLLGEVLETKKTLKVIILFYNTASHAKDSRLQISPIYSLVVCSTKFLKLCLPCSLHFLHCQNYTQSI